MEKKSKFHIGKGTLTYAAVAAAIAFIAYVVSLIAIEAVTQQNISVPYFLYVIRDVLLMISTILLTTIFTGWLIEVRSKNDIYANAVLQDVVANPVFYKEFSDDVKRSMLRELEKELLFCDSYELQNMYGSIQRKLSAVKDDGYYFTACNYHVVCSIRDGIITKTIDRRIRLRSYEPHYSVDNLPVLNWVGLEGIKDQFQLNSIIYNSEAMNTSQYEVMTKRHPSAAESFCGYSVANFCRLTEPVELSADKDTIISVSYVTKVPLSDNVYTCRSSVPCRHFSVDVTLTDSPDYKLNAVAFGFLDTAKNSPICLNDREVRIEFDDWVFNKDGVTIVFAPKQPAVMEPEEAQEAAEAVPVG